MATFTPLQAILKRPALATFAAGGLIVGVVGFFQQGYDLWLGGVQAWQLQAAGFVMFVLSVGILLYRWEKEHHLPFLEARESAPQAHSALPLAAVPEAVSADEPEPGGSYDGAHFDLLMFVLEHLLPTVESLFAYQESIVAAVIASDPTKALMLDGVKWRQSQSAMLEGYAPLEGLGGSPMLFIDQESMEQHVAKVERYYRGYADTVESMRGDLKGELDESGWPAQAGSDWRVHHNALIAAYDEIKRNPKLKTLFRPALPARFGARR